MKMDLLDLNNTEPSGFNASDSRDRLDQSDRYRARLLSRRGDLENVKKLFQLQKDATKTAVQEATAARIYLEQLDGGWGAPIAGVGPATLYQFWLEIPGYSGPPKGFTASSSQTGQVQHVSRVTSKTTSGAGCATIGCLAAGPLGAILGATMGKKNDVKTDVQVIDNRRFEIQVIGPGVAWSYVGNYSIEDSVRSFRDLLLARSTTTEDPKVLAAAQREVVAVKNRSVDLEYLKLNEVENALREASESYESAWAEYEGVRLPVIADLIARWKRSSLTIKSATLLFGPVLLVSWIMTIILAVKPSAAYSSALLAAVLQFVVVLLSVVYYRIEIRVLKTLPSESPVYASIVQLFEKIKQ
jgi:hypothetical protein